MNQDNEAESQKAQPIGPLFRSTEYAEAPEIPDEMLARWKTTANLMSEIAGVPTGVITRVHATQLEVLVACDRDDNPYKQGLRADLNTGMCCETVMQERAQLLVPNALKDPEWADNPNVSLGLISYLGFPLQWGNGEIFGTICVLDNKENAFGGTYQKLLETFKHAIESDLKLVKQMAERRRGDTEVEQLLSDRRHLLGLIESTSDFVGMANLYGEVMYINPAGMAMLGRTGEDYRSLTVADTHPDEDTRRLFDEIQPLLKERGIWNGELSMIHRNGSLIPVSMVLVLLRSSAGEPVGMATIVRDISDRIRIEEELKASEQRYRDLYDLAPDMFASVDAATAHILDCNQTMAAATGYTKDEILGRPIFDMYHSDCMAEVKKAFRSFVETGDVKNAELQLKRKDGRKIDVILKVSAVRDAEGRILRSRSVWRDITQRKVSERALQASEQRTRLILDMSHDAFVGIDAEGNITDWNPQAEEVFGWKRQEVLGRSLAETIIPPQYRDAHRKGIEHFFATGEGPVLNKLIELTALHRDGHEFPVELTISPIPLGETYLFSAFVRDITGRKEAENALRKARDAADVANRAKSQFLSSMSHELRTPLNGVLGYVQILQRDPTVSRQHRECLDAIESCGQQLLTLINDVLDLSKIESGSLEVDLRPCDLSRLLGDVHMVVHQQAVSKGLRMTLDVAPEVPRAVITDATKLRQVLINLLGNAVKFTQQGSIDLRVAETTTKLLQLTVQDTGPGISAEKLDEIFDPFKQVDGGVDSGGTGLGLAISRRLVEALGGDLQVQSTPGQGSQFSVTLPLVEADDAELAEAKEDNLPIEHNLVLADDQVVTVLIADDRDSNRDILVRMLQAAGFHTVEAVNGKDALSKLREHAMPLVLMDVRMPEMNGLEATREIRNDSSLAKVVVIAVSASVFPESKNRIVEAGCDDFIGKPIDTSELLSKIERHLNLTFVRRDWETGPDSESLQPPELSPELAREVAQQVRTAVEIGDITKLGEVASQLSTRSDEASQFGETIDRLAKAFDFEGLKHLADELDESARARG